MKRIDIDTERLRTSCWVSGPENGTPVLDRYRKASGASVRQEVLEGAGHGPLIERSERVAELMREVMGLG